MSWKVEDSDFVNFLGQDQIEKRLSHLYCLVESRMPYWSYQKIILAKNVHLNSYSLMEKKIRKIWIIFDIENSLWKSVFGTGQGCKAKVGFFSESAMCFLDLQISKKNI